MTWPFDHTHDHDLGVSEIDLSKKRDSRLTWNKNDASHSFMTMILTSVTMVGWTDVLDNDRGDFRRRRAVDISSFSMIISYKSTYNGHHQIIFIVQMHLDIFINVCKNVKMTKNIVAAVLHQTHDITFGWYNKNLKHFPCKVKT